MRAWVGVGVGWGVAGGGGAPCVGLLNAALVLAVYGSE